MMGFCYNRLFLAASSLATATLPPSPSPSPTSGTVTVEPDSANIQQLADTLNSDVSSEEKTNFLIEYLLAQRSVILDALKVLLFALLVFVIGRKVVKVALKLTYKWMQKREVEISVQKFVMSFARVAYNLVLIFIIAGILGVSTTIVALVGSAGLAIGLALQGSLSNLAGGILILSLKPFKVGDYIITTGAEGTVQSIDVFYTRLSTTDNKIIVIPNGTITSSNITNSTNASERMLILDFTVSYGTDIEAMKAVLIDILQKNPDVSQEEPMDVVISRLTPLKVQMQLKAWTKTEDYWKVRYGLLEKLKQIVEENEARLQENNQH